VTGNNVQKQARLLEESAREGKEDKKSLTGKGEAFSVIDMASPTRFELVLPT
jgi:hypothetical protein